MPVSFDLKPSHNYSFHLIFKNDYNVTYKLEILPGALTDFVGNKNKDTINTKIDIPSKNTYSNLSVKVTDLQKQPVFIELMDDKNKIVRKSLTQKQPYFHFKNLKPGKYKLRLVVDTNQNNNWDTGNFLLHKKAEKSIDYPIILDLRANWEVNQSIRLNSEQ